MRKHKFIFLLLLALPFSAGAQFLIGWTGGHTRVRELNREIYVYNKLNSTGSGLTKEMKEIHWFQGPTVGFRFGKDIYFELLYNRKKARTMSIFDSSGVTMNRQMKVYCNTFNLGFGATSNGWGIGGSLDFGRFKGFGRRGPEDGIKDVEWRRLWVLNNTRLLGIAVDRLYMSGTVWVERSFGIATIRLYAQPFGIKNKLDGLDAWLFGADLNYAMPSEEHFINSGIAAYLNLGRK